ncbi:MAG: exopolysaccharide biosynthesis polyprenyl glycosylphosphotransferase [Candidatus Doudnabacteria bacterium]|nr:exopolysaccharide biosynthesis polyprenyl glycosylphosphotransferase [Candidatus Doudnabacteria bacterium]
MSKPALRFWLIVIPTAAIFYLSLQATLVLRYHGQLAYDALDAHYKIFSIIFVIWLLVFFIHGLFDVRVFRRYSSLFFNLVSAMAVNLLLAIIYFYFQPNLILTPRRILLLLVGVAFVLILLWYLLVKYIFKSRLSEGIYLFSFNNELSELEGEIKGHAFLGFRVLGHLNQQSLGQMALDKNSSIIFPDNLQASPQTAEQMYQLRTLGVRFYNHKSFYEQLLRRIYLSQIDELWFLENIDYQEKRFYNLAKRAMDIILGAIGLIFFLASLPFCALLIKLADRKGSIFFVQERVGRGGKLFKVYKYRTMNSWGVTNTWTSANDPRITGVGKFLRKSRIDEWPQFINLLFGHMSLVGPRPEQPHIVEELKKQIPFYDERHLVKPGLTGWAQINNIYAASLEETRTKLQYDLYYIKHRSLLFDLEIILKTIYYIFTWQGR